MENTENFDTEELTAEEIAELKRMKREKALEAERETARLQAIVLTRLQKKVNDRLKRLKEIGTESMQEPGDSKAVTFDLDGQKLQLGKVTVTEPKWGWGVESVEELTAWAKDNMPELGAYTFTLKDDKVKELLDTVVANNAAVHPETGEEIPGIAWRVASRSYPRFTPDKGIDETLALLAAEGRLNDVTGGLLELDK